MLEVLKVKTQAGVMFGFFAGIILIAGTVITGVSTPVRLALIAGTAVAMYSIDKIGQACGWKARTDR